MKMEAACSSEASVHIYQATTRHVSEDFSLQGILIYLTRVVCFKSYLKNTLRELCRLLSGLQSAALLHYNAV